MVLHKRNEKGDCGGAGQLVNVVSVRKEEGATSLRTKHNRLQLV